MNRFTFVDLKLLVLTRNKTINSLQDSAKKLIDARKKVSIVSAVHRIHGPLSSQPFRGNFQDSAHSGIRGSVSPQQFTTFVQMRFMGVAVNASSNAGDGGCTWGIHGLISQLKCPQTPVWWSQHSAQRMLREKSY